MAVFAADVDRRWLVRVAERLTVSDDGAGADAAITGTAAQLYLALWNRGDEIARAEPPDLLDRWRAAATGSLGLSGDHRLRDSGTAAAGTRPSCPHQPTEPTTTRRGPSPNWSGPVTSRW